MGFPHFKHCGFSHKAIFSAATLAAALLLSGCDTKDRTPLPGDRENFITLDQGITLEKDEKDPIVIDPAQTNPDWTQTGGNAKHLMPPATMRDKPELLWKKSIGLGSQDEQRLISNIITHGDVVFTMDANGNVSALNAKDGEILWATPTSPEDTNDETLGGGICHDGGNIIYAGTSFGDVIALNAKDGKELWRHNVKTPIRTAPTYEGGKVFVISISNEAFALKADNGEVLWTHSGILEPAALLGGSTPAVQDEIVIITYSSGEIYALHKENGQVLWSDTLTATIRTDTVSSVPHIRARPILFNDHVIVVSHAGRMVSIDIKTGAREWQRPVSGIRTPAASGNAVFTLNKQNDVIAMNAKTGAIRWATVLPSLTEEDKNPIFWAGPTLVNDCLVFSGSNGEVRFLKASNGELAHTLKLEDAAVLSPVVANGQLYILSDSGVLYAWK